jgi:hypothetical protein
MQSQPQSFELSHTNFIFGQKNAILNGNATFHQWPQPLLLIVQFLLNSNKTPHLAPYLS